MLFAAFVLAGSPSTGTSQAPSTADHAERVRRVSASVQQEASCVQAVSQRVAMTLTLLEEAEEQLARGQAPGGDVALAQAARQTIEALWLRLRETVSGLSDCRGDHLGGERITYDRDGNPVLHVDAEADPGADRIGEDGNTLQVIDSGARLSSQVWIVSGQQVDGAARPSPEPSIGYARQAQALEACYRSLQTRQHAGELTVDLSFSVLANGRVRRVELSPGMALERRFSRCITQRVGRMTTSSRFQGGPITLSYRLRFAGAQ